MKSLLRPSTLIGLSQPKELKKPPVLSQFSATATGFMSPIKNRPNTIGVNEGKE